MDETGVESILPVAPLRCISAAVTGLQAVCFGTKLCIGCKTCPGGKTAPASRVDMLSMRQSFRKHLPNPITGRRLFVNLTKHSHELNPSVWYAWVCCVLGHSISRSKQSLVWTSKISLVFHLKKAHMHCPDLLLLSQSRQPSLDP